MAHASQHKEVKRKCPGCGKEKTFPARNDACSAVCARIVASAPSAAKQHALKLEIRELKRQLRDALDDRVFDQRYQEFIGEAASRPVSVPDWVTVPASKERHMVIPTASFSDWHLDEIVKPEAVQNLNGYDRQIAERRLRNYFQNGIDILTKYLGGFRYPGIVMPWMGDLFSGNIHEELRNTNADVILSSLLHWRGPMIAGLKQWADVFGRVYVPVVVGNHGRNTIKPIHKNRVRDNFDWLFARMVESEIADDKRITFAISESPEFTYSAFGTTYHILHGDQAKGGTGIAAQWSPLMLLAARRLKRRRFDYLVCGHWHTLGQFQRIRANGSGIGPSEYAFNGSFDLQPPLQDLWLTDPTHGIVCDFPIHVMSKDEPWAPRVSQAVEPFKVVA